MDVRNVALVGAGGVAATLALVADPDEHDPALRAAVGAVGVGLAAVGGARFARMRHDALLPGVAERYGLTPEQLRSTRYAGGSFNDALHGAIRVRIEGSGPLSQRTIVAETRRAQQLLSGRRGAAAESMIRSLLAGRDDLSDTSRITSISFAQSRRAFVASHMLSRLDDALRSAAGDPHVHPNAGTVHDAHRVMANTAAVASIGGTHVDIGTGTVGREFERLVARRAGGTIGLAAWSAAHPGAALHNLGTRLLGTHPGSFFAAMAAHELQHTATFMSHRDATRHGTRLNWLLEGAAERAGWRSGATMAESIGTRWRYPGSASTQYYLHHVRTARALDLAGVPGNAGDTLLAGVSAHEALDRIVARIAAKHSLTADEQAQVRTRLQGIDGAPRLLDEVESMLAARAGNPPSGGGGGTPTRAQSRTGAGSLPGAGW